MTVRILQGHVLDVLAGLPAESVHMVMTSPPYWGLRAYGTEPQVWGGDAACEHEWGSLERGKRKDMLPADKTTSAGRSGVDERQDGASHCGGNFCLRCNAWRGEHGLEPTVEMWVEHEVAIWRAVRRVLRKDGTVWINIGDAYASAPNGATAAQTKAKGDDRTFRDRPIATTGGSLKPKDRIGLPHRLVFALQADGWWWRDEICWHKPNPMPSSVKDRTCPSHEFIFTLSKRAKYYYDNIAIMEPTAQASIERYIQPTIEGQTGGPKQDVYEAGLTGQKTRSRRPAEIVKSLAAKRRPSGWDTAPGAHSTLRHNQGGRRESEGGDNEWPMRQRRSVWTIATQPFPEAHFATFPTALVEPCILAGTSARGVCPTCGAPWERTQKRERIGDRNTPERSYQESGVLSRTVHSGGHPSAKVLSEIWSPSCGCEAGAPVPSVVLDPFAGSGTVGLVADRLGRDAVLIELKPEYAEMARKRVAEDQASRGVKTSDTEPTMRGDDMPLFKGTGEGARRHERRRNQL